MAPHEAAQSCAAARRSDDSRHSKGCNQGGSNEQAQAPLNAQDHIQGRPDAPIQLVEYGDYECPFGGQAHPIVKPQVLLSVLQQMRGALELR